MPPLSIPAGVLAGPPRSRAIVAARLVAVVAVTPVIASAVGLMIRADIGVGPVDLATLGLAERFGVAVGTASLGLAVVVAAVAAVLGVAPGLGTIATLPVFASSLTIAVSVIPDAHGPLALVQFAVALPIAAAGVAFVVSADVGTGPPEALMLAVSQRFGRPIAPVRVVQDLVLAGLGVALGARIGLGTAAVAFGFGPAVAGLLPRTGRLVAGLDRTVDRWTKAN